jgi:hypothetical protein
MRTARVRHSVNERFCLFGMIVLPVLTLFGASAAVSSVVMQCLYVAVTVFTVISDFFMSI